MKFKSKEELAKALEIMAREGPLTLSELYAKMEGVSNPSLNQSLKYYAPEWADEYTRAVFPGGNPLGTRLFDAIKWAFEAGTLLACQALERGQIDETYGELWGRLMAEAKLDV